MRKWPAVVMMLIGAAMIAAGAAGAITSAVSLFQSSGSTTSTPGQLRVNLQPGTWIVYQTVVAPTAPPTLDPDAITVTGPQGDVPTRCVYCNGKRETLTLGNTVYSGVASFDAPSEGTYIVDVTAAATEVVVAPSVGGLIGKLFGWIALIVGGFAVGFAGLVWLIVAAVKGKPTAGSGPPGYPVGQATYQPSQPAPTYGAPTQVPGSWYPDPQDPERLRWWDGRQWTDQTADRPH